MADRHIDSTARPKRKRTAAIVLIVICILAVAGISIYLASPYHHGNSNRTYYGAAKVFDVVLWHDGVRSEIEGYGGDPESPTFVAHGWSRGWARNGVLTYEARYEDGGPVGTARYWNEEGTLVEEHVFHDDENARDVNRQRVNKPGFQYATIKVYERGVLVQMRTYEDGRLEGKEYEYYSDGKIKIIKMWKRGEQIGKAQEYGRDGKAIENEE